MRRKLLIALFALGTVGGYAGGFASMRCHRGGRWGNHDGFEQHVARVCADAALRTEGRRPPPPPRGDDADLR